MGSPVSPIVANLYMEHFEERSIREAPHPPDIWLRYVDDTFSVTRERSRTFHAPSEFNGREQVYGRTRTGQYVIDISESNPHEPIFELGF